MATPRGSLVAPASRWLRRSPAGAPSWPGPILVALLALVGPRAGAAQDLGGIRLAPEADPARVDAGGRADPRDPPPLTETDWIGRWARPSGDRQPAAIGPRGAGGSSGGEAGQGGSGGPSAANSGAANLPDPFGPVFEAINPARLHRRLDEALGLDAGRDSPKPEAPEIPLAVFLEVIRPLGGLKYENQTNYFVGAFTGGAPTLQELSFEYVFADWNSARLELTYPNGNLEALVVGYQHTLGVGRRGNWIHGFQVIPEIFLQRDFVGGRAFYLLGWKPEKESPWSAALSLGADRASIEGSEALRGPMARQRPGPGGDAGGAEGGEGPASVWRPLISVDAFYTFGPSLSVGLENDLFPSSQLGEYLILPNFTWRPTQHFFVQVGAGYYQLGSEGQATFMCRVNLLNPSPRRPRGRQPGGEPACQFLSRRFGGR
jgi:hypothetical protein